MRNDALKSMDTMLSLQSFFMSKEVSGLEEVVMIKLIFVEKTIEKAYMA